MPEYRELQNLDAGMAMHVYSRPCAGCLAWIAGATEITFENGRTFTVGIAGGYNANGLFGHEGNGVFVGDDNSGNIVITGQGNVPGACLVPTTTQVELYKYLLTLTWDQFRDWVNSDAIVQIPTFIGRRFKI